MHRAEIQKCPVVEQMRQRQIEAAEIGFVDGGAGFHSRA